MICDFHAHLYEEPGYADALAETARGLGVEKMCIGGGEARYGLASNEAALEQSERYPELFVPFALLRLGADGPSEVTRLSETGFRGLRVAAPPAPYDQERFFPVYEAAQALDLPILFHTGILPPTPLDRAFDVRADRSRPIHLDTLARQFPMLSIVGCGLGWPWYEEAAEVMSLHANVYFDLSGVTLRKKGPDFFAALLGAAPATLLGRPQGGATCPRLLFGTGARPDSIADIECEYERLFRTMALGTDAIDEIMGGAAARMLGLEQGD